MSPDLSIDGILETVVYCTSDTEAATRAFYEQVLGLRPVGLGGAAYRVADGQVLLLFNWEQSSIQTDPPAHGAPGRIHTCFLVEPSEYEGWKSRIDAAGMTITSEHAWKEGILSFYFEDPAGNVLEIAGGDLWPR